MPEIGANDPDEYANLVYNRWGIGNKGEDKGVLVFLTLKERKLRIEVGYGLEGILPDGLAGEIRDRYLVPYFKKGLYGEGLYQGLKAISEVIQRGEPAPTKDKKKGSKVLPLSGQLILLLFLILILVNLFGRRRHYYGPVFFGGFGSFGGGHGSGMGSFGAFGGGMSGGGGASGSF
jgi:uncharacterized protein